MTDSSTELERHFLDRTWRLWATVAILGVLAFGALLGVVVIPVVQGIKSGIDPYTAICRALGILPGSPARVQSPERKPGQPVSQVVWTPDILQVLATARPDRGAAKVQEVCAVCHGSDGMSPTPDNPNLAGQSGAAIYKQLHDYRTGSRVHELMTDIAKALDENIIADIAAYYAAQPKRNLPLVTLAEAPAAVVRLVELGDPSRYIPPCASCHRPGSGGPIETPILAEQNNEYFVRQLQDYVSGKRRNDVYGRMRLIASQLTEAEMRGLAAYYRAGFR